MYDPRMALDDCGGRSLPRRSDSRDSRTRLIDAIGAYADLHGQRPPTLTELATFAALSPATAYRHFASIDEAANVYLSRLPEHAVLLVSRHPPADTPIGRLHQWNQAWVKSCHRFARASVGLRSSEGILARRRHGEPVVTFVCVHIEPLLAELTCHVPPLLLVWNAVSDPREVLDMRATLRWSGERAARFITDTTEGAASALVQSSGRSTAEWYDAIHDGNY